MMQIVFWKGRLIIRLKLYWFFVCIIPSIIRRSVDRHSCYMLRADELYNEVTQDVASKGASQGMFIGCFIDTATGWISFTCEGKETKHRYKV